VVRSTEIRSRHAQTLERIYERIRNDQNLRFLDGQIFPAWDKLKPIDVGEFTAALPNKPGELRAGFYQCHSMLRFMEGVFAHLDLEQDAAHPDNRGWLNLFKHWSWCAMLRVTWALCAPTHGARFQGFCQRELGLSLGELDVKPVEGFGEEPLQRLQQVPTFNFLERGLLRSLSNSTS
jgi:hypothetical protein